VEIWFIGSIQWQVELPNLHFINVSVMYGFIIFLLHMQTKHTQISVINEDADLHGFVQLQLQTPILLFKLSNSDSRFRLHRLTNFCYDSRLSSGCSATDFSITAPDSDPEVQVFFFNSNSKFEHRLRFESSESVTSNIEKNVRMASKCMKQEYEIRNM